MVNSAFNSMAGSNYSIVSAFEKADSAVVGAGLAIDLGSNLVGRVSYQGRYSGDLDNNAVQVGLAFSF